MTGILPLLKSQGGIAILDGGLGTAMQSRGYDLNKQLWSAHYIKEDPRAIEDIHRDYYLAGADIAITASYQASTDLFVDVFKITPDEANNLIAKSVQIADSARIKASEKLNRKNLIIAASIGPYGACLAGGEEYHGNYGKELGEEFIREWHRKRFEILVDQTNADILAMETIPCLTEVRALLQLLPSRPNARAWISVSCSDEHSLRSGESLVDFIKAVENLDKNGQVEAIGVNCTPPTFIPKIIEQIRQHSSRPIVIYPNNGDIYDGKKRIWLKVGDDKNPQAYAAEAVKWRDQGSPIIIGGCCMTDHKIIKEISA